MAIVLEIEPQLEQEFLAEPKAVREVAVQNFIKDFLDKQQRQRKREALLNNLSPITQKYSGFLRRDLEKQGVYKEWTDEEIAQAKDEYLTEKYGN